MKNTNFIFATGAKNALNAKAEDRRYMIDYAKPIKSDDKDPQLYRLKYITRTVK